MHYDHAGFAGTGRNCDFIAPRRGQQHGQGRRRSRVPQTGNCHTLLPRLGQANVTLCCLLSTVAELGDRSIPASLIPSAIGTLNAAAAVLHAVEASAAETATDVSLALVRSAMQTPAVAGPASAVGLFVRSSAVAATREALHLSTAISHGPTPTPKELALLAKQWPWTLWRETGGATVAVPPPADVSWLAGQAAGQKDIAQLLDAGQVTDCSTGRVQAACPTQYSHSRRHSDCALFCVHGSHSRSNHTTSLSASASVPAATVSVCVCVSSVTTA
jgi:hypothetical protein